MSGGPRPKSSLMRLVGGDQHAERARNDKPKHAKPPQLPPGAELTVAEMDMWHWLLEHVYTPGVHGSGDGAAFVKVARLWARVQEADDRVRLHGLTSAGGTKLAPLTRLSRDLWQQLGIALAEIGATPSGRVKIAGPREAANGNSWGDIDP